MADGTTGLVEQPKITLHWLEVSRSHRILWLLEELGVSYDLKIWKRGRDGLADPKLKQIHPLGKSPVITIENPGTSEPIVIADSAAIVEYLCDYYGQNLVPQRYVDGQQGRIGTESEAWIRNRFYLHYAEGSLMPLMVMSLIFHKVETSAPFFIRPIASSIVSRVKSFFLAPNFETHYKFLEEQLATSPGEGDYLCGRDLSSADIMMSFPLEAGKSRSGKTQVEYPRVWAYVERLHQREAYKRSVAKIEQMAGSFKTNL